MRYRIVSLTETGWNKQEVDGILALIDLMKASGNEQTGINSNHRQRAELQGQLTFRGFLGPMFDGDAIRYESQQAYDTLSI